MTKLEELTAENVVLKKLMQGFVDRCEKGDIHNTKTYNSIKQALQNSTPQVEALQALIEAANNIVTEMLNLVSACEEPEDIFHPRDCKLLEAVRKYKETL